MKPQRNPNMWSCLPAAFATILNLDLQDMLERIGHNGSEIIHPGLREPLNRKGFHPQETIKICLKDGYSVTRVELFPTAVPRHNTDQPKLFDIGGWDWFNENMFESQGVIECRTAAGTGHAMAYRGAANRKYADIYDPGSGELFKFHEPRDAEKRNRFLVALWRIDE